MEFGNRQVPDHRTGSGNAAGEGPGRYPSLVRKPSVSNSAGQYHLPSFAVGL